MSSLTHLPEQMPSLRADASEAGCRAVQPFLTAWKSDDGLQAYASDGTGPDGTEALLAGTVASGVALQGCHDC